MAGPKSRARPTLHLMNKYSSRVTQPRSQGASQAMLYGIGLTDADLQKPQVGICSMVRGQHVQHALDRLAASRKACRPPDAGGASLQHGRRQRRLSMGTDRDELLAPVADLIADSIETVMGAQWYDALIPVPGCDKNMPGSVIAMARLNRPSLMVYGGTIRAGFAQGEAARHHLGLSVMRRVSGRDNHRRTAAGHRAPRLPRRRRVRRHVLANTMAVAIEALGLSLPHSSSMPAEDPGKADECRRAGAALRTLLERDLKPRDILTRKSFENAMTMIMAVGGSTSAVLHLLAMAKAANVPLELADFQRASDRMPLLADLKPVGAVQEDLHAVGGTPAVMKCPCWSRASCTATR